MCEVACARGLCDGVQWRVCGKALFRARYQRRLAQVARLRGGSAGSACPIMVVLRRRWGSFAVRISLRALGTEALSCKLTVTVSASTV